LMYGKGVAAGNFGGYSELEAQNSSFYNPKGEDLLNFFLKK